jgi:hypothetical protein
MVKNRILGPLAVFLLASLLFLWNCEKGTKIEPKPSSEEETTSEQEPELITKPVQAVCIFDGLSFWNSPSTKKGYQNYEIRKGESLTFLGKREKEQDDKRSREFLNIRLSDGSEGWGISSFIVIDAEPAAVIEKVSIYSKNNLISKTSSSYEPMDILAVSEKQDEWIKVKGYFSSPDYWIKPGNLTFAEVDIAVAYQYMKAMDEKEDSLIKEKLIKDILEEEAFTDSIFIPKVQAEVQAILDREREAQEDESESAAPDGQPKEESGSSESTSQ